MATKKKTRGKTKAKRKKTPATKPATRRKAKTVKKGPAKRASRASRKKAARAKRVAARRTPAKKAAVKRTPAAKVAVKRTPTRPPEPAAETPIPPAQAAPPGERIGVVTHYFNHLSVATVRLDSGTLRVGDVIHIRGHTTDFSQRVESLEINHAPATEVGPGDDFGLKVTEHAREHDVVYKVGPR
jgi:Elongation factor Tu domain 2